MSTTVKLALKRYVVLRDELLADRGVRFWLKDAITKLDQRDPVDALRDAEALADLQRKRVAELIVTPPKG